MRNVRSVWDLTLEEIEELHTKRHLNNYVHAGLLVPLLSAWPSSPTRSLTRVDPYLYYLPIEQAAAALLGHVPELLDGSDHSGTRLRVTRDLFRLYRSLPVLDADHVPAIMRLFASLAFIILKAERNDNMPLWIPSPIRKAYPTHDNTFLRLLRPDVTLEDLLPFWKDEFEKSKIEMLPARLVFPLTMRSVQAILIMVENGTSHTVAAEALVNLEHAMLDYEQRHKLLGSIRYRNTLYLYGGNMFQRMGRLDTAYAWYLKHIDYPELPKQFKGSGFMIPLKTCERLITACEIAPVGERPRLISLTNATLAVVLGMARAYAQDILSEIDKYPEADLRPAWVKLGEKSWLYGGEACREPVLASLLYQKMVQCVPYADTDYSLLVV